MQAGPVREPAGPVREQGQCEEWALAGVLSPALSTYLHGGSGAGTGACVRHLWLADPPPATPVRQEVALSLGGTRKWALAEAWSQQDLGQTCGCEELVQVSEVRRSSDP